MSCSENFPGCNNATSYFGVNPLPEFSLVSECCNCQTTNNVPVGVHVMQIQGTNDTDSIDPVNCPGGWSFRIDGTAAATQGCNNTDNPPCIVNDIGGLLTVVSYTAGDIPVGGQFQITIAFNRPDCQCYDVQTVLRVFPVAVPDQGGICDTGNNTPCCEIDIPITIDVADDGPMHASVAGLNFNVCIGQCDNQSFTITNDSCLSRKYHVALNGPCSAGLSIDPPVADFILAPAAVSNPINIKYCPTVIESGACQVKITLVPISDTDPCCTELFVPIAFNSFTTYDCVDGVCVENQNCNGQYTSLQDCQQNCEVTTFSCCNGQCVPDVNGPYNSLEECQAACAPDIPPPTCICLNCDFVTLNGVKIDASPCKNTCANIGDVLEITLNVGFPLRSFAIFGVNQGLQTFSIVGNWTAGFTNGKVFAVSGSACNNGNYTVVSSLFDGTFTVITVFQAIPCAIADGFLQLQPNDCPGNVSVTVTNTDTGQVILDTDYPANAGDIIQDIINIIIATYGTYHIEVVAEDCFDSHKCEWLLTACTQYELKKNKCYEYTLTDNDTTTPKILTITVTDLDGSYTASYTLDTSLTNSIVITLPADGIYTVQITNNLTDDVILLEIIELCQLEECIKKLILDLFCAEIDPCCKECNETQLEKQRQLRYEFNKIVALYQTLTVLIKKYEVNWVGVFTPDECRTAQLLEISDIFERLNKVTDRCGDCNKTKIITPAPCKSC